LETGRKVSTGKVSRGKLFIPLSIPGSVTALEKQDPTTIRPNRENGRRAGADHVGWEEQRVQYMEKLF